MMRAQAPLVYHSVMCLRAPKHHSRVIPTTIESLAESAEHWLALTALWETGKDGGYHARIEMLVIVSVILKIADFVSLGILSYLARVKHTVPFARNDLRDRDDAGVGREVPGRVPKQEAVGGAAVSSQLGR